MDKFVSTIKRKSRGSSSGDSVCSPYEKKQKEGSCSEEVSSEAFNMTDGSAENVDLILSKLSKLDKLDQIELRLNNVATSVSSIEMSVSKLEEDVSALTPKLRLSIARSTC